MSRQEIPYKLRLGNVNIQVGRVERVVHLIGISFSMTRAIDIYDDCSWKVLIGYFIINQPM